VKRTWKRIAIILLLVLLLAPLLTYVALKTSWGKSYAIENLTRVISNELGVQVEIGDVAFDPVKTLALKDVLVHDHRSDTLLQAESVFASISLFKLGAKQIHLDRLEISNGLFKMTKAEGEEDLNLVKLIDGIRSKESSGEKWDFQLETIALEAMSIVHWDENKPLMDARRMDPAHMVLSEVSGEIQQITFLDQGVSFVTRQLEASERSGLRVENLDSDIVIDGKTLAIQEMMLMTADSEVTGSVAVDFSSDLDEELGIEAHLVDSKVKVSDLGYFVEGYDQLDGRVDVDADIRGSLSDLSVKQTTIRFGSNSSVTLDGSIKGLPSIDSLLLDVDISPLNTDLTDLRSLPIPGMRQQVDKLPRQAYTLGRVAFNGHFEGYLEDFEATGVLETEIGTANAEMSVYIDEHSSQNRYIGRMGLRDLELGTLLGDPEFGQMNSDLDVDIEGHGQELSAQLDGEVQHLDYKGYSYRNLKVDGRLEERLFNGFLSIRQPEIDMDFRGLVDLRSSVPEFQFTAEVFQADIGGLGFASQLDSTSMTGLIQADFKGDEIDEFQGSVSVKSLSFCREDQEFFFDDFDLVAAMEENERTVLLRSDMADARIQGRFIYTDLKNNFLAMFDDILPSLYEQDYEFAEAPARMDFELTLKKTESLTRLIDDGLYIGVGTRLQGALDTERGYFQLNLFADTTTYRFVSLEGVYLEVYKEYDVAYTSLETLNMQWGDSLRFADNLYTFNAYNDSIETDFTWSLVDKDASGSVSALSIVHSPDSIINVLYPSQMIMSGDYWLTEGLSNFTYSHGELTVQNARLSNGKESIQMHGVIGAEAQDRLDFDVTDFQLENLNKFFPPDIVTLDGKTTLNGHATSILGQPTVVADMLIEDFTLGGERIGDLDLGSTWDRGKEFLRLDGFLENQGVKELQLDGRYFPTAEEDNLDARLLFDGFHLGILNKLPTGGINQIGGQASGDLSLKGSLLEPDINGELSFTDASVRIDYLNTRYYFNDKVVVRKDYIGTNYIPFRDEFGNQGYLNGTVAHENYRDWNYDIFADFEKMLVLNTTEQMNPVFYGKVFGTGSVSLFGYDQNLNIEIYGKTEAGTTIDLPLGSSEEVVLEDYIYFKSTEEAEELEEEKGTPTSIELFMEAQTTPDAQIRLIFDEKIGDVMQGRGMGTLTMTLDRAGTMEIFGNYTITEGDYLFTLQNVVNKRFQVLPGSTVSFYGDPYRAELDLTTSYSLRASLADLLSSDGVSYSNRVPVECQMELEGELFNPDIGFNIEFPGLDPGLESLAQSKLDTEEELNRQVFSLLVLNKFLSSQPTDATAGISAATTTINEFASSQLSNWLSQISEDVDVGVNYRSGDNITSEELAVALTTQLFSDRLLLSGNFGVQNAPNSSVERASSIIGDFRLEYILTKDGKLRLKVFNETNDYSFLNSDQADTKQGVGLIFQREFDGLFNDPPVN
jgi:hypothetical protein